MADLFIFTIILSSMALAADIVERVLTYKQNKEIEKERVIDLEYSEEDIMKANEIYEKILNKIVKGESCEECKNWHPAYYDIDNDFVVADEVQSSLAKAMIKQVEDFVELNGEKVVYNEDDQE